MSTNLKPLVKKSQYGRTYQPSAAGIRPWNDGRGTGSDTRFDNEKVYLCECGAKVCWVMGKFGKRYLSDVSKHTNPRTKYVSYDITYNPHHKSCKHGDNA